METLFFWFFSFGMIICGLAVILNRNPIASALCFTFTIVFMSALFVMLNAFFLAAVQILVTAGAVMVLFLFIIMLLDITAMEHVPRQKIWMGCTLVLALGFIYVVALTLNKTPMGAVTAPVALDQTPNPNFNTHGKEAPYAMDMMDDTHRIGRLLFTRYVAPFEITSLLILVATIGVIVICKQDEPPRPSPREEIVSEAPPLNSKKETSLTR